MLICCLDWFGHSRRDRRDKDGYGITTFWSVVIGSDIHKKRPVGSSAISFRPAHTSQRERESLGKLTHARAARIIGLGQRVSIDLMMVWTVITFINKINSELCVAVPIIQKWKLKKVITRYCKTNRHVISLFTTWVLILIGSIIHGSGNGRFHLKGSPWGWTKSYIGDCLHTVLGV